MLIASSLVEEIASVPFSTTITDAFILVSLRPSLLLIEELAGLRVKVELIETLPLFTRSAAAVASLVISTSVRLTSITANALISGTPLSQLPGVCQSAVPAPAVQLVVVWADKL